MFSASQMKICELCENAGINSTKLGEWLNFVLTPIAKL